LFLPVVLLAPVLSIVLGAVGIVVGMIATGHSSPAAIKAMTMAMQDPKNSGSFFALIAVTFGALLLSLWAMARLIQGKRFGDIVGRWRWSLVGKGFALWFGVVTLSVLLDFALRPKGFSVAPAIRAPLFILWAAPALALQTFTEEFIFRGWITQGLVRAFKRPWVASLISGLIFGAAHVPNGRVQAASATVLGVVFVYMAIKTGGLALGWGVHLVNNLFAGIVVVSSSDVFNGAPGLFYQNTPGLEGVDLMFNVAAPLIAAWFLLRKRMTASSASA